MKKNTLCFFVILTTYVMSACFSKASAQLPVTPIDGTPFFLVKENGGFNLTADSTSEQQNRHKLRPKEHLLLMELLNESDWSKDFQSLVSKLWPKDIDSFNKISESSLLRLRAQKNNLNKVLRKFGYEVISIESKFQVVQMGFPEKVQLPNKSNQDQNDKLHPFYQGFVGSQRKMAMFLIMADQNIREQIVFYPFSIIHDLVFTGVDSIKTSDLAKGFSLLKESNELLNDAIIVGNDGVEISLSEDVRKKVLQSK